MYVVKAELQRAADNAEPAWAKEYASVAAVYGGESRKGDGALVG